MKVFISQSMKNKSPALLLEERQIVNKLLEEKGYIVLDSILEIPNATAIKYLAKSIEILDQADIVVFMEGWKN